MKKKLSEKLYRKLTAILLSGVLAFSLVGCGDTRSSDNTAASDDTAQSEAVDESSDNEVTDITFVLDWTPNTNHTGLYVALDKGYFDEAGFNVSLVQPPDNGATDMVASGDAQFGIDFQDTLAPALTGDNPLPVTAIAAVLQHNTSGLVSLKEKGIDSFGKMAGHSYATWDSPTEQAILKTLVEKDGASWDDVNLISTYVEDIVAGLNSDIDSVWIYEGWDKVKLDMEGIENNFILFRDADEVFDYYSPVIIANNDYISANADKTKAFIEAVRKGYEYAATNPDEAADILLKAAPELDEKLVKESQKSLSKEYVSDAEKWGVIDLDRWNAFYKYLDDNNLVETPLGEGAGVSLDYL